MAHADEAHTCGKGIAANAELPEALAGALRGTADVLDNPVRSLDPNEANGQAETAAYRQLVAEHHDIGGRLVALAERMRGYCGLPLATHDMDVVMDEASFKAFADSVVREKDLLALLQARVAEHEAMLHAMDEG